MYCLPNMKSPLMLINLRKRFKQIAFVLKVPMKQKIIAPYLKGFSKLRRVAFSFLEYLFSF